MGKIKKMNELTFISRLSSQETQNVKGGIGPECSFSTVLSGKLLPEDTKPKPVDCGCGCSGCTWEDGGAGFAVGMSATNTDGVQCNFAAVG